MFDFSWDIGREMDDFSWDNYRLLQTIIHWADRDDHYEEPEYNPSKRAGLYKLAKGKMIVRFFIDKQLINIQYDYGDYKELSVGFNKMKQIYKQLLNESFYICDPLPGDWEVDYDEDGNRYFVGYCDIKDRPYNPLLNG